MEDNAMPVTEEAEMLRTVGALKEILKDVPDDYELSICGINPYILGVKVDNDNESVYIDEKSYLIDCFDLEEGE